MEHTQMQDLSQRRLVTIMQATRLVGVARRTVYNWIQQGKIEYIRNAGGAVRIYEDSLWRHEKRRDGPEALQGFLER